MSTPGPLSWDGGNGLIAASKTPVIRVLWSGSREWADRASVWRRAAKIAQERDTACRYVFVHGDAEGLDLHVRAYVEHARAAGQLWLDQERHPITRAQWREHGKYAGYLRNRTMVQAGAAWAEVFIRDHSRGATMTKDLAVAAGIPVNLHQWEDRYLENQYSFIPATARR